MEDKIDDTPFAVLDRWNVEHGYDSDELESLDYVEQIRDMRKNKESKSW